MRRSESQIDCVVIPQPGKVAKFMCSARALRPPGLLWMPPVDPFEHIGHLSRRDRHRARRCSGPDELTTLQTFGIERHAKTVVPENLDQLAVLAAEHVEVAAMRVALQRFLHQQRQRVHAATHVGVAGRQPNAHPRGKRDHCRCPHQSAPIAAVSVAGSTAPAIRIRAPLDTSISIVPEATRLAGPASGATCTGAKLVDGCVPNWRRQPYSWLACIPASRASTD